MNTHWQSGSALWSGRDRARVRLGHLTGGQLASWISPGIGALLNAELGLDWTENMGRPGFWDGLVRLDAAALWHVHLDLKARLLQAVREDARERWTRRDAGLSRVGTGTLLSASVLTIGFMRRSGGTRRTPLVFRDLERLRRLLTNWRQPVQLVFCADPHPSDELIREARFEGRIAFIDSGERALVQRLVLGVDLWLNLPPTLPDGTAGGSVKAGLNGVLQFGLETELDVGDRLLGWAIPRATDEPDGDRAEAEQLYDFLEREVVPLFYARDAHGLPRSWAEKMKRALRAAGERFSAQRTGRPGRYTQGAAS